MQKSKELLSLPLDQDSPGFIALAKLQASIAANVLTTVVRVDTNRLKKQEHDTLSDLLDKFNDARRRMKLVELAPIAAE